MFKNLSSKKKVILFIIVTILAIILVIVPSYKANQKSKELTKKVEIEKEKEATKQNSIKKEKENKIQQDSKKKADIEDKYQQGYNAFEMDKYKDAIDIEDEVISEDNSNYKAYALKGLALSYSGKYQDGMKSIDTSLNLKPDYGYGMFCKARSYEIYGHYAEALEWFNKDISEEDYSWSYYGKASVYGRMNDVANACKYLKIAIGKNTQVITEAQSDSDFGGIRDNGEFKQLISK